MNKDIKVAFPYVGSDANYVFSDGAQHSGIYIHNSDPVNTLYFSLGSLGELPLKAEMEYIELFQNPPAEVTLRNPSGCLFMIGRID